MNLLEDAWIEFRNTVIAADAPPEQVRHYRRTFFAGAIAFYSLLTKKLTGKTGSPEETALLTALVTELGAFIRRETTRSSDRN